jgi:hypothetical protein
MKVKVTYDPKPVPFCNFDYEAYVDSWDLGDPLGYGSTQEEAVQHLLDQLEGSENETIEVV